MEDELLKRLAAYEAWANGLRVRLAAAQAQSDKLKAAGRANSSAFRQLLAQRLMLMDMLRGLPDAVPSQNKEDIV